VIAILGGLGAATAWAVATLCSSRSSRTIGSGSTLSLVMLVGLVVTIPFVAVEGVPPGLDAGTAGWLVVAGAGNVVGLALVYAALRVGKVGIVAPIASTEGAVTAVIAVAAGEQISPGAGAMLGVIVVGVLLAALSPRGSRAGSGSGSRAALLAFGAAILFGIGLYAAGRVSTDLPVAWILLPTRVMAVLFVAVPLAAALRLRLTRATVPLVVVAGLCEVAGLAAFTLGARHGIAVTVVVASQYAAIAAVAAYVVFRERLTPLQVTGVAAIVVGVSALSVLTA
jgi:drug/metabolite transporter (DMT)-like permease